MDKASWTLSIIVETKLILHKNHGTYVLDGNSEIGAHARSNL